MADMMIYHQYSNDIVWKVNKWTQEQIQSDLHQILNIKTAMAADLSTRRAIALSSLYECSGYGPPLCVYVPKASSCKVQLKHKRLNSSTKQVFTDKIQLNFSAVIGVFRESG